MGFDVAEVKRYSRTFWQHARELADYDKIMARMARGEARRAQQSHLIELLKSTFSKYRDPMREVTLHDLLGATASSTW